MRNTKALPRELTEKEKREAKVAAALEKIKIMKSSYSSSTKLNLPTLTSESELSEDTELVDSIREEE